MLFQIGGFQQFVYKIDGVHPGVLNSARYGTGPVVLAIDQLFPPFEGSLSPFQGAPFAARRQTTGAGIPVQTKIETDL